MSINAQKYHIEKPTYSFDNKHKESILRVDMNKNKRAIYGGYGLGVNGAFHEFNIMYVGKHGYFGVSQLYYMKKEVIVGPIAQIPYAIPSGSTYETRNILVYQAWQIKVGIKIFEW